jgi:hypothetical protein
MTNSDWTRKPRVTLDVSKIDEDPPLKTPVRVRILDAGVYVPTEGGSHSLWMRVELLAGKHAGQVVRLSNRMDGPGKVAIRDLLHAVDVVIEHGQLDPISLRGKDLTLMIVNDRTPGYYCWAIIQAAVSADEPG